MGYIVNQKRDKIYNTDKILSVSIQGDSIYLKTETAEIPIGTYTGKTALAKVIEMIENHLTGRFYMPGEEELKENIKITCPSCGMVNIISEDIILKLANAKTDCEIEFYCSACGNKIKEEY